MYFLSVCKIHIFSSGRMSYTVLNLMNEMLFDECGLLIKFNYMLRIKGEIKLP